MQEKLLKDVVVEVAGEQAGGVFDTLSEKKDVNEFLIAKKLKMTINQVRNVFYKLANFGLVSFTRKKDRRKGWYTYFWTLNPEKTLELLERKVGKEIESLQQQLKSRETKRFYFCKTCKTEVSEETALLHNFTCQECGEVYELSSNDKVISMLKVRIAKLERQKENVSEELKKIREEGRKKILAKEKRRKKQKKSSGKKAKNKSKNLKSKRKKRK